MAIVTICRGSYAGGRTVAERLAELLGYPILGREEVLTETARDYDVSEKELSKMMNGAPPFWQQVPGKRLASAIHWARAPLARGGKPKKWAGVAGSPETDSAAITAEGPGTATTS